MKGFESLNLITSQQQSYQFAKRAYLSFFAFLLLLSEMYMTQKNPMILLTKTRSIGGTKLKLRNTGRVKYFQLARRTLL